MSREEPCSDRVAGHWAGRRADLALYKDDYDIRESGNDDVGPYHEYDLGFDYVAPGTFSDQRRGYWRYQISWGGPSEEIRFYGELGGGEAYLDKIEFWFLDWGDGACIDVTEDEVALWMWGDFHDTESLAYAHRQAFE